MYKRLFKQKKSEEEMYSFNWYYTEPFFFKIWSKEFSLLARKMQIFVTHNVNLRTHSLTLYEYGRSAITKRNDEFFRVFE